METVRYNVRLKIQCSEEVSLIVKTERYCEVTNVNMIKMELNREIERFDKVNTRIIVLNFDICSRTISRLSNVVSSSTEFF